MAFEGIQDPELARQDAQHGRSRRSTFKLVTGLMDREPGGGSKDQDPQQVQLLRPGVTVMTSDTTSVSMYSQRNPLMVRGAGEQWLLGKDR